MESNFIQCHFGKELKNNNQRSTCTIENCKESFCSLCIENIFKENFIEVIKELKENGWICYKCNDLC